MTIQHAYKQWYWPGQVDGWQNLQQRSVPIPQPGPGEVLIKIHAVSLNFRELMIARKLYVGEPAPELVPGADPAGEIVALGQEVTSWNLGDRVLAGFYLDDFGGEVTPDKHNSAMGSGRQGTLQEYRVLPANVLVRIPAHMSYEEASTLTCAGLTAYNALLGGPIPLKAGQTVLLQGTGGVSLFAAQIAVLSGARVILTSSSEEKLQTAAKLGVHETINYKTHPDWEKVVLELTKGVGADHVLDVVGGATLSQSLKALAHAGQLTIIGILGRFDSPPDMLMSVMLKNAIVRGITVGSLDMLRNFIRLVEVHKLKPVVGRVFGFEDVKKAYECLEKQDFVGKIVVKVSSP
ncbi:NAD(P)-binding protein [Auricularia subglabra TFB-10046 SS5]|nr:NAD(P)-binding protein [Auricularia subglabra TFB-10046 SS5]